MPGQAMSGAPMPGISCQGQFCLVTGLSIELFIELHIIFDCLLIVLALGLLIGLLIGLSIGLLIELSTNCLSHCLLDWQCLLNCFLDCLLDISSVLIFLLLVLHLKAACSIDSEFCFVQIRNRARLRTRASCNEALCRSTKLSSEHIVKTTKV